MDPILGGLAAVLQVREALVQRLGVKTREPGRPGANPGHRHGASVSPPVKWANDRVVRVQ